MPAWRCPKCGRTFANRNQWHSCGTYTAAEHLKGASPAVRALYRELEAVVRACGPVTVSPTKASIAFKAGPAFAAASVRKEGLRVGFLLDRELESPRFVRTQSLSPRSHEHVLLVRDARDLDDEVRGWLREAYEVTVRRGRLRRG